MSFPYSEDHAVSPLSADTDDGAARREQSLPPAPSPSGSGNPDGPEQSEAERIASSEDKRRRNTAASARFRIKKKQRILNLERSLSDLNGRANDLEGEAAALRRENGWLREIIMLKGVAGRALLPLPTQKALERSEAEVSKSPSHSDDSETEEVAQPQI